MEEQRINKVNQDKNIRDDDTNWWNIYEPYSFI